MSHTAQHQLCLDAINHPNIQHQITKLVRQFLVKKAFDECTALFEDLDAAPLNRLDEAMKEIE